MPARVKRLLRRPPADKDGALGVRPARCHGVVDAETGSREPVDSGRALAEPIAGIIDNHDVHVIGLREPVEFPVLLDHARNEAITVMRSG